MVKNGTMGRLLTSPLSKLLPYYSKTVVVCVHSTRVLCRCSGKMSGFAVQRLCQFSTSMYSLQWLCRTGSPPFQSMIDHLCSGLPNGVASPRVVSMSRSRWPAREPPVFERVHTNRCVPQRLRTAGESQAARLHGVDLCVCLVGGLSPSLP